MILILEFIYLSTLYFGYIYIFIMDEFTTDDNLYRLWQHIRPMNVFDHRPKALSFPTRDHLVVLRLGGQDFYELCIFILWILCWIGLEEFSRHWYCLWDYLRSIAGLNTSTPIIRPNMKFCIRARNLVVHRCEISKVFGGLSTDRCSKFPS